jgi:thioredoxin-like negative regulator of GroEL
MDAAASYFEGAIDLDPGFVPAYTELAKIALIRDDLSTTSRWLDAAAEQGADHEFVHQYRWEVQQRLRALRDRVAAHAEAAADAEDLDAAIAALAEFDPYLSLDCEPLAWRARLEFSAKRLEQARASIATYLREHGGTFDELVLQAEIILELEQALDADQMLTVALGYAANQPTEQNEWEEEGRVLAYSTARGRARAHAARAWARAALARNLAATADIEASTGALDDGPTHLYRARAFTLLDKPDEAASEARLALSAVLPIAPWLRGFATSLLHIK